jgi:hypothetical protein
MRLPFYQGALAYRAMSEAEDNEDEPEPGTVEVRGRSRVKDQEINHNTAALRAAAKAVGDDPSEAKVVPLSILMGENPGLGEYTTVKKQ